jgi:CheY-like chemotaxis protein
MTSHSDDPLGPTLEQAMQQAAQQESPEKLLHDIITPLLIIKMNTELLGKYLPQLITGLQEQSANKDLLPADDKITTALLHAPKVISNNIETVLKKHRQLANALTNGPTLNRLSAETSSEHFTFSIDSVINRILLVEDEIVHRDIGINLLSQKFHLDCANNGLEAIQMCKQTKYDLILMDMHMPKMNGMEATEELRKFISDHTIIIGLTSLPLGKKRNELIEIGFNAFLEKPLKLESFKHLLGLLNTSDDT